MLHQLTFTQILRTDQVTAWKFISDPRNLARITPAEMSFTIVGQPSENMYPGQIIQYKVSPLAGIKMNWVTEITHVKEGKYFVDEQRFGPYAFWHHQHFIEQVESGVLMTDILHYKIPFGLLGKLVNALFIRKKLGHIFSFRYAELERLFGGPEKK